MSGIDWEAVRCEFPAVERAAYLDNGAAGLVPRAAQMVMADYYRGIPFNAGLRLSPTVSYGGVGEDAEAVTGGVAAARDEIRRALGGGAGDLAFTKNATEALSLIAEGLPWQAGDEILISEVEHQSGTLPWMRVAAERKLELGWIPTDAAGRVDSADVERRLTRRTRVVALIHVSSLFGTVEPVEAVGELTRRRGVMLVVDGAQAAGRIPVDVGRMGCDFFVASGHKGLLGPQGIGIVIGSPGALAKVRPPAIGSRSAVLDAHSGALDYALAPAPFHLEAGALNAASVLGLGASVAFLGRLGWAEVFSRIATLGGALWAAIATAPGVEIYGDRADAARTGIVSFNVHGRDSGEVCRTLWRGARVLVSPGIHGSPLALRKLGVTGTVRASVHCYNTEGEIEQLARALAALSRE
jgi:cysteine desulfurase/selenocysteine lyase